MDGGRGRQIVPRGWTELTGRQGTALQGKMLFSGEDEDGADIEAFFLMKIIGS